MYHESEHTEEPMSARKAGIFLSALVTAYRRAGLREKGPAYDEAPKVVKKHLGPPMDSLPSFSLDNTQNMQATGIGSFTDFTHAAMRQQGKALGLFLANAKEPDFKGKDLWQGYDTIKGDEYEPGKYQLDDAHFSMPGPDRGMGYMMYQLSKGFKSRPEQEQQAIDSTVGNAETAFFNAMQMQEAIEDRLKLMPEDARAGLMRKFGLTMDMERIEKRFEGSAPHIAKLGNLFALVQDLGERGLDESARIAMEELLKTVGRDMAITIRDNDDAAITLFALHRRLDRMGKMPNVTGTEIGELCNAITPDVPYARTARGDDGQRHDALLRVKEILGKWDGLRPGLDEHSTEALDKLELWVERQISQGIRVNR